MHMQCRRLCIVWCPVIADRLCLVAVCACSPVETDTGSACNTNSRQCSEQILADRESLRERMSKVKERIFFKDEVK